MKKSAFTLIELLVVISIIAILASIALPVFGGVLERARVTKDGSNLRQIGIGFSAFLNDNDELGPVGTNSWVLYAGENDSTLYPKYIGDFKVFKSDFDKRQVDSTTTGAASLVSYSFNQNILRPSTPSASKTVWNGDFGRIKARSQIYLMLPNYTGDPKASREAFGVKGKNVAKEVTAVTAGAPLMTKGLSGGTAGGGRVQVLFGDVHVDSVLLKDLQKDTAGVSWDPLAEPK